MLEFSNEISNSSNLNIFGEKLKPCCVDPMTGFFRDGSCKSDKRDFGNHSVCAILTDEFLAYTKGQGNDLSTPNPRYGFPGLKAGDKWCLCATRWLEAKRAGINLDVDLWATNIRSLEVTSDFDFKWKNRVVKCSSDLFLNQFNELQANKSLQKELKLVAVPDIDLTSTCQLIGLDGGVKKESSSIFKLSELKEIINTMPMRQAELKNNN
jgi:uncharacterized protein (DUF2237 family)